MSVTTVEGVGSERKCVHQVQKRIATWWQQIPLGNVEEIRDQIRTFDCEFPCPFEKLHTLTSHLLYAH